MEQLFIDLLKTNPEDKLNKLAYADWLEENNGDSYLISGLRYAANKGVYPKNGFRSGYYWNAIIISDTYNPSYIGDLYYYLNKIDKKEVMLDSVTNAYFRIGKCLYFKELV